MRLFDTQRSGNAWKVRLLAGFLGLPFDRVTLSIDRGDLRQAGFRRLTPFAQVPVLEIEGGDTIAESAAILFYLAQGSAWWPDDVRIQARVISWLSFEQERHMKPLAQLRLHRALRRDCVWDSPGMLAFAAEAQSALTVLDTALSERGDDLWIATDAAPSIADVALYPYSRLAPMGGMQLEEFPAVMRWLTRFESIPSYTPLFPGHPEMNFSTNETRDMT